MLLKEWTYVVTSSIVGMGACAPPGGGGGGERRKGHTAQGSALRKPAVLRLVTPR